jgi:hypothetical protein
MNDIKKDTNLSEAVNRWEQQLPPMPDGLNERLMKRLQETTDATQSQRHRIGIYSTIAAAACLLLIIGIGTMLTPDRLTPKEEIVEIKAQQQTTNTAQETVKPLQQLANITKKAVKPSPLNSRGNMQCTQRVAKGSKSIATERLTRQIPDTLGNSIWQSEQNVQRALQLLSECEATIRREEQEVRNHIIQATFNAMPQPANAILVTNENGDYEVIETKNIIEL